LEQDSDLSITEIAKECGVSECYFRRLFQEYSGESPINFRQKHRIEKAKQLLLSDEHYSVGEIAEELGFSDIYHFSKTFKKFCGISPNKFVQIELEKMN
jgi:AraC-like DNA-binding protein